MTINPVRVLCLCHPSNEEVAAELIQLSRQIERGPEEHAIEIFATNGADEPFDEGMTRGLASQSRKGNRGS